MIKPNLWQKLAAVIAALMLMCCMALLALQMRANTRHEQEVVQRLSLGLAEHIAQRSELMDTSGMRDAAVRALFGQLMAVNPSVEVYLLDDQAASSATMHPAAIWCATGGRGAIAPPAVRRAVADPWR